MIESIRIVVGSRNNALVASKNDELGYAIHFLFDDTSLSEAPEKLIGLFLKDETEARAVKTVCSALDNLFNKYGYDKTDKEYLDLPEWDNVVGSASKAILIIQSQK